MSVPSLHWRHQGVLVPSFAWLAMQLKHLKVYSKAMESHVTEVDQKYAVVYGKLEELQATLCTAETHLSQAQAQNAALRTQLGAVQVRGPSQSLLA